MEELMSDTAVFQKLTLSVCIVWGPYIRWLENFLLWCLTPRELP